MKQADRRSLLCESAGRIPLRATRCSFALGRKGRAGPRCRGLARSRSDSARERSRPEPQAATRTQRQCAVVHGAVVHGADRVHADLYCACRQRRECMVAVIDALSNQTGSTPPTILDGMQARAPRLRGRGWTARIHVRFSEATHGGGAASASGDRVGPWRFGIVYLSTREGRSRRARIRIASIWSRRPPALTLRRLAIADSSDRNGQRSGHRSGQRPFDLHSAAPAAAHRVRAPPAPASRRTLAAHA